MTKQSQNKGRTLQQSLLWFISGLLVILLLGSFVLNISVTREYLQKQLESHAQDTATSLGLSLSSNIDARDHVAAGRMVDAIFDRGDYRKMVLFDLKGAAIIIRQNTLAIEHVPNWFIRSVSLSAPARSAQVVKGWTQLGTIVVESHPGYAYVELWQIIQTQLLWFIVIAFASFLVAKRLLNGILKPLKQLELHAQQVGHKEFDRHAPLPKTRELARVAQAMNTMADQLGAVFQKQLDLIEDLRSHSFVDNLTGLSNREGFDGRLKTELDSQQYTAQGSLMLVQLHEFAHINETLGREKGDALLIALASILKTLIEQNQGAFSARRNGADFSLFLPNVTADAVDELSQHVTAELTSLTEIKQLLRDDSVHVGVACVREGDTARILLSKADMALRQAQARGVSGWQRYANIEAVAEAVKEVRQANEWRAVLEGVLSTRSLELHTQAVFDEKREVLYQQVLSRIELDGKLVVAGIFLPMAERFQLMVPIDQLVIEKVISALSVKGASYAGEGESEPKSLLRYCVTLSENALVDERFMEWFDLQMSAHPEVARILMIEVTEHVVSYNEPALINLGRLAKRHKFKVSIERFGVSSVPFSYLQRVQIDVIKVDHSFIRHIEANQSNQFFLRSAVQIAHGQSIDIVAVGVESQDEWQTLNSIGLDGAMGYYLERPKVSKVFG